MAHRITHRFRPCSALALVAIGACAASAHASAQPTAPEVRPLPIPSNVPPPDATLPPGSAPPGEDGTHPAPSASILETLTPGSRKVVIKRAKWVFDMPDGTIVDYWPLAMAQDFTRRFVRFDPPPPPKKGAPAGPTIGGAPEVLHAQDSPEAIALGWADSVRGTGGVAQGAPQLHQTWREGKEVGVGFDGSLQLFCTDPLFRPTKEPFAHPGVEVAPGIYEMKVRHREGWTLSTLDATFTVRFGEGQLQGNRIKLKEFFVQRTDEMTAIGGRGYNPYRLLDADTLRMKPARLAEAVLHGELRLVDWKLHKTGQGKGPQDYRWTPEFVELHLKEKPPEPKPGD